MERLRMVEEVVREKGWGLAPPSVPAAGVLGVWEGGGGVAEVSRGSAVPRFEWVLGVANC